MPRRIIRAPHKVVERDVEVVCESDENIKGRLAPLGLVILHSFKMFRQILVHIYHITVARGRAITSICMEARK